MNLRKVPVTESQDWKMRSRKNKIRGNSEYWLLVRLRTILATRLGVLSPKMANPVRMKDVSEKAA